MIPIRLIAYGVGALLAVSAVTWVVHSYNEGLREQGREEVRKQVADAKKAADELQRQKEDFWRAQTDEARKNATERDVTIRSLAAAASTPSNSLRDALASLSRQASTATAEANAKSTIALAAILNDCQASYRELAEKADRHVNDIKTMQEAWPTNK
jgi:preprotein translocase subunit SecF